MSELTTKAIEPGSITLKEGSGEFSLAFSPFDIVDLDNDVVRRSAIPVGLKLPLLQGHMQHERAVGVGTVSHSASHAVLTGTFIDSTAGKDAHETVKATADIQELSWGFSILEAAPSIVDGQQVREITKTVPHEVSLVLRGAAGIGNTGVLNIKEDGGLKFASEGQTVLAAVIAFKGRAEALAALREGEGRELSASVKSQLLEIAGELGESMDTLALLVGEPESDEEEKAEAEQDVQAAMRAAEIRFTSLTAREQD